MKINVLNFISMINRYNIPRDDQKYFVAFALAKSMAYRCHLPTAPVDDVGTWFTNTHKAAVEDVIGKVNESTVINVQEVYELTYKIWKLRYRVVFDVRAVDVMVFLECQAFGENNEIPQIYKEVFMKETSGGVIGEYTRDVEFCFIDESTTAAE